MSATKLFLAIAGAAAVPSAAHAQIMAEKADGSITSASIYALIGITASVVGIIVGFATLLRSNKAARREAQRDADERADKVLGKIDANQRTTDDRLKSLEVRVERFVPGDIIEHKLEHLKSNRVQVELRQQEQLKEISACMTEQGKQISRLEERHDGTDRMVQEVKTAIRDMRDDIKAEFKELKARAA